MTEKDKTITVFTGSKTAPTVVKIQSLENKSIKSGSLEAQAPCNLLCENIKDALR